jgi:hypothetical protein
MTKPIDVPRDRHGRILKINQTVRLGNGAYSGYYGRVLLVQGDRVTITVPALAADLIPATTTLHRTWVTVVDTNRVVTELNRMVE